jgi:hypothetical protein
MVMNTTAFKTQDINLAASLRLAGYPLENIEMHNGNKGIFVFLNVDDEFVNRYNLGNHLVEPSAFNHMIKQLTTSVRRLINTR